METGDVVLGIGGIFLQKGEDRESWSAWPLPDTSRRHRCIAGAERHAAVRGSLLSLGSLMLSLGLAGPMCLPAATTQLHTVPPPLALIPAVDCSENRPRRETPISPAQNTVTPTAVPPFVSVHHHFLRKPTLTIQGLPLLCPGLWLHCVTAYHCLTLCRRSHPQLTHH